MLRFIAASTAAYRCGLAIAGGKGWPELFTQMGWGIYSTDIAVDILLIVVGFMTIGSSLWLQHLGDLLWARVLRIFPAVCASAEICGSGIPWRKPRVLMSQGIPSRKGAWITHEIVPPAPSMMLVCSFCRHGLISMPSWNRANQYMR